MTALLMTINDPSQIPWTAAMPPRELLCQTGLPSVDPQGSVTIVDLSAGVARAAVRTATVTSFNGLALNPGLTFIREENSPAVFRMLAATRAVTGNTLRSSPVF